MIRNIRSAFIDMLEESTWMDTVSKRRAIEKVNKYKKINQEINNYFNIGISN